MAVYKKPFPKISSSLGQTLLRELPLALNSRFPGRAAAVRHRVNLLRSLHPQVTIRNLAAHLGVKETQLQQLHSRGRKGVPLGEAELFFSHHRGILPEPGLEPGAQAKAGLPARRRTAFEKASPQARIFIAGRVNELKMEIARLEGAHRELRARGKDVRVIEASIRQLQREAKDLKR